MLFSSDIQQSVYQWIIKPHTVIEKIKCFYLVGWRSFITWRESESFPFCLYYLKRNTMGTLTCMNFAQSVVSLVHVWRHAWLLSYVGMLVLRRHDCLYSIIICWNAGPEKA